MIATFLKAVGFLGRPLELQATRVAEDTVYLSWKDNSRGEDKFLMYRTDDPQTWPNRDDPYLEPISGLAGEGSVVPMDEPWFETNVIRGQNYWYRVATCRGGDYDTSEYADSVKCDIPYLNVPAALAVIPESYNSVKLEWTDMSIYEAQYLVQPGNTVFDKSDQGRDKRVDRTMDLASGFKLDERQIFTLTARYFDHGTSTWRESSPSKEMSTPLSGKSGFKKQCMG
jgi:hypothetical protein